jgi:hypothetical protein
LDWARTSELAAGCWLDEREVVAIVDATIDLVGVPRQAHTAWVVDEPAVNRKARGQEDEDLLVVRLLPARLPGEPEDETFE